MTENWEKYREKIIGLGEGSSRKSYYPELQDKINELETSKNNLLTIINSISDALFIHDQSGKILLLNKRAQELYQISENELDKFTIKDINSIKVDYNQLYRIWENAINGITSIFEWTTVSIKTHEEIPVQVSINSTIWNGKVVLIAIVRDFTERKKYEEDLIEARMKAEEHDRLKSAFLANISHEIRTPMNGILGFAELLKLPNLTNDEMSGYIQIIEHSGERMLNIINNLMDISKIESGQMKVRYSDVIIEEQLNYIYQFFNPEAEKKGLSLLKIGSIPGNSMKIHTDQEKLNAILINLIKNAIKFCNQGAIEFGYTVSGKCFLFFVKDTGIGISKENIQNIFQRFLRGDHEMSAKYEGAGLGLAIVKAYIDMLGGKIWVESKKGIGSQFFFTLPMTPVNSVCKE
ncbi:MAG TPA: PAS domain-containing sensor histidine kinase [Prolixibacteraceae bacterium]|nr:PAS domain-containing sensor histidine kinase [Prolixibacteraceae bacterium]